MSELEDQCQTIPLAVPDVWLEAGASSQVLEPFFSFLPQGLGLYLLPKLGCCHCHCLGLSA